MMRFICAVWVSGWLLGAQPSAAPVAEPSVLVAQPSPQPGPRLDRHEFVIRDFKTESGVVLPDARVVYTTLGKLNATGDNAILLPSHYMANFSGYNWLIGGD